MPDEARQHDPDTARPSATRYSLTLNETARLFAEAGLPRNSRSLQRYCAAGRLDCIKEETATGLTFFVDPASVERAITQLAQLHGITDEVRQGAAEPDMSPSVAPAIEPNAKFDQPRPSAVERDTVAQEIPERPTSPQSDMSRYVAQVESENAMLKEHVAFLREQSQVKDTQIAALLERDRETNYLVRGLQHMLAPLLGRGGEPTLPTPLAHHEAADERMSDEEKDIGIGA
ncbi:hypothetical protein [Methylocystis hirsuta]|uniref:Uncharacterized protein n=1 Tax=Methylocystis hirsuta TaxID=369798 RepID=A0A3M9XRN1_9HYPH|nr:hypothetical protein [Methylocystis hirsuta]RNJ50939.1 hypothetical protein D1O30_16460 [Methylocystis hirsuta]